MHIHKEWADFLKRWKPADKVVKQNLKSLKLKDRIKPREEEGVLYFPQRHRIRRVMLMQVGLYWLLVVVACMQCVAVVC